MDGLPGAQAGDGWRRMHPFTPLLQGGLALIVIAGILVANFRDRLIELFVDARFDGSPDASSERDLLDLFNYLAEEGLLLVVIGGLLAVVLLILLFSWLSWRMHSYRISNDEVEARQGIVFKRHRRAPLQRIQSVNLQRPLLARMLGLTKIDVQTAGQGGKVELAYLAHRDAKTVREQIIRSAARSRGAIEGPEDAPQHSDQAALSAAPALPTEVPVSPTAALDRRVLDFADADIDHAAEREGVLVRVPVGRLVLGILLGWEMIALLVVVAAMIVGSFWNLGVLAGFVPAGIVFAGLLFSQFNKGFNFTLTRSRDGVRVGSGLTATNTESIPFGRIHAVEARQPLGWRPFGWWRVRITTAGYSAAQAGQNPIQNVVLPVGPERDVLRVLEALLPATGAEERDIESLRNGLSGPGSGYTGGGSRSGIVLWWGRRRAGILLEGADRAGEEIQNPERATLRVRKGALTRGFVVMPVLRAQSVQLRRPAVHRLLGLASLQAHTVLGPVTVQMRGLDLTVARCLFDRLAETVVRVQNAERHDAVQSDVHSVAQDADLQVDPWGEQRIDGGQA